MTRGRYAGFYASLFVLALSLSLVSTAAAEGPWDADAVGGKNSSKACSSGSVTVSAAPTPSPWYSSGPVFWGGVWLDRIAIWWALRTSDQSNVGQQTVELGGTTVESARKFHRFER